MTGRIVQFKERLSAAVGGTRPAGQVARPRPLDRPTSAPPRELSGSSRSAQFRALILPHLDSAYAFARYLSRDATVAEDVAQEALLKAFRGFDAYRGGDAKSWLLAIVRNAWFDHVRARRSRGYGDEASDAASEIADDQPSAELQLIRQGDAATVRAAIDDLPEPFREALVLRELEELSYKAIAEITGVPMGTVMSRLARARELLGNRLRREPNR